MGFFLALCLFRTGAPGAPTLSLVDGGGGTPSQFPCRLVSAALLPLITPCGNSFYDNGGGKCRSASPASLQPPARRPGEIWRIKGHRPPKKPQKGNHFSLDGPGARVSGSPLFISSQSLFCPILFSSFFFPWKIPA